MFLHEVTIFNVANFHSFNDSTNWFIYRTYMYDT